MKKFLVYRHIRPDKDEVFYIGKGLECSKRQYSKQSRSKYWHNIVKSAKGSYLVDILISDLTEQEACDKEIEFIKLYGRKDLGEGTLCNLTNGGEGTTGFKHSEKTKIKMSNSAKGKPTSEETKFKISRSKLGKPINKETPILIETQEKAWESSRKKVICTKTKRIFISVKEASNNTGINYSTLKDYLRGFRRNKTTLEYYKFD